MAVGHSSWWWGPIHPSIHPAGARESVTQNRLFHTISLVIPHPKRCTWAKSIHPGPPYQWRHCCCAGLLIFVYGFSVEALPPYTPKAQDCIQKTRIIYMWKTPLNIRMHIYSFSTIRIHFVYSLLWYPSAKTGARLGSIGWTAYRTVATTFSFLFVFHYTQQYAGYIYIYMYVGFHKRTRTVGAGDCWRCRYEQAKRFSPDSTWTFYSVSCRRLIVVDAKTQFSCCHHLFFEVKS